MERTPIPATEGSTAIWLPQQPRPLGSAAPRSHVDYAPVSYPPLSQAHAWAQAQKAYISPTASWSQRTWQYRSGLIVQLVAAAILLVGGSSVAVAATHSPAKASSSVAGDARR